MKKIFTLMLLAIVAIFIYSCKKEEINLTPITNSGNEVYFSAAIGEDQQTKTTFNDQTLELFWKSNDKVYIWHKEASSGTGALGTYKASADGAQTNLVPDGGSPLQWIDGTNTFSSVYVCNTSPTHLEDNFTISLPAIQDQSQANSTDHFGDYMAMKGYLSTTHTGVEDVGNVDIHFSPLYSVLEFAFPYDKSKKVTKVEADIISDEGDQVLAFETANVSKNDNSTEITGLTTPSKKVTLNLTTQMDLSKGISKAWMIVKPGTYESIKFTYTYASGEPDTKDFTNVTIERGTRYNITTYGNIVHNIANADDNTVNTLENAISAKFGDEAITSLKVTGTMNQADFATLKNMTTLATLDLSEVRVVGNIIIGYDYDYDYNPSTEITQSGNAIPYFAFGKDSGNTTLKSILLPKNITTIGDAAFYNCSGLTGNLTLPSTITTIGAGAFYYCFGFNGTLTISEGVETIGVSAFRFCSGLTGNLTIPSTVKTIGDAAFNYCSSLTGNLSIPEGVETIEDGVFSDCTGLTGNLTIPEGVTTINEHAFHNCTGLTGNLTIPSTVSTIGDFAFSNCSSLESLSLNWMNASDIPTYSDYMFPAQFTKSYIGVKRLVTVPEGCESNYSDKYGWKELNITKVVHNTANATDPNDNKLEDAIKAQLHTEDLGTITSMKVTGTMNQADFATLNGMTTLATLDLSDVRVVGDIKIKSDNTTQNGNAIPYEAFRNNTALNSILLPISITTIGEGAFASCTGFTGNLTIPSTVTTIGESAFANCSGLTGNLTIPSTVSTIGGYAFYDCSNLTSLSLNWKTDSEIPTYSSNMFPSQFIVYAADKKIVTVPVGSKSAYMEKNGWKSLNITQDE